jgi:hypothetical protein
MKEQFDALVARLNEATNKLAATLTDLRDKLAAGGMTKAEEDAAVASLDASIASLEALGADPANPVPEPAPGGDV